MTSFPGLGPSSGFLQSPAWRAALALVVVFVMLAMTGWTAIRGSKADANPLATAKAAWQHATFHGRPLPAPDASPSKLRAFFSSLDRAERKQLATRYPLVVGNWAAPPSSCATGPTAWRSTMPAPRSGSAWATASSRPSAARRRDG